MAFDNKLLEILACPTCKGKLHYVNADKTAGNDIADFSQTILVCRSDRLVYPIRENIPVLIESEAKQIASDQIELLLKA